MQVPLVYSLASLVNPGCMLDQTEQAMANILAEEITSSEENMDFTRLGNLNKLSS